MITPFSELEFINAFEALVFRNIAAAHQVDATIRAFRSDLEMGVLRRQSLPPRAFEQATSLSRRETRKLGCRTLDILHVAIAVELAAEIFFTFDNAQAKLAKRAGLAVRPTR